MTLGSPPQSPVAGYYSPPLHSLSIASPTHQQHHYQHNSSGQYQQQQQHMATAQPQHQSGYLPGFLMGDPVMASPSTPSQFSNFSALTYFFSFLPSAFNLMFCFSYV